MMGGLLSVRDLAITYESKLHRIHAVNGVSFTIHEGETCGVIGETGCGKSSVARSMVGLLPEAATVTHGTAEFRGQDLLSLTQKGWRELRAGSIGFMPQNSFGALNPVVRLDRQFHDIIKLVHRNTNISQSRERASALLARTGIEQPDRVLRGYAHELSGGMAQRVVIAMTMVRDPALIVADEPTTGLDLTVRRQIMDMLADLRDESGVAVMLVTHTLELVAQHCDTVLVMYAGQIVEAGPVSSVFKSPRHPYTEALLGCVPHRGRPLQLIPGGVAPLYDPPSACVFYERCTYRSDERCRTERPPQRQIAPSHWVSTFCDITEEERIDGVANVR